MAGPSSTESIGIEISLITGPLLLGYLFGYGLLGILSVKIFFYHLHFASDSRWIKITVWTLFLAECITTIFATIGAWNGLAAGWGRVTALATVNWSFDFLFPLSGLLQSIVQGFFCWRIYKFTSTIWLPVLIGVVSLAQWIIAFYIGVTLHLKHGQINQAGWSFFDVTTGWVVTSAICDVLITVSMVTILLRVETDKTMLGRVKYMMETGMANSITAILEIIFILEFRSNNIPFILLLMLPHIHSNTMLAVLNSRTTPKPHLQAPDITQRLTGSEVENPFESQPSMEAPQTCDQSQSALTLNRSSSGSRDSPSRPPSDPSPFDDPSTPVPNTFPPEAYHTLTPRPRTTFPRTRNSRTSSEYSVYSEASASPTASSTRTFSTPPPSYRTSGL